MAWQHPRATLQLASEQQWAQPTEKLHSFFSTSMTVAQGFFKPNGFEGLCPTRLGAMLTLAPQGKHLEAAGVTLVPLY
jgi:hypothetical protein